MLTVDDIIPLVGAPLDEAVIDRLVGTRGERSSDELDEGHPEDQRHYYTIRTLGLEMILDGELIDTVFFKLPRKRGGHPWTLRNGLNHLSSRDDVLNAMGIPERSGKPDHDANGCVGHDRFRIGDALLHFEYTNDCAGVEMITAMRPSTAPGGG